MPFRFAVIADSHFHPVKGQAQRTYPSDLQHNGRNEKVVALLRRVAPDFVVHLGDVPHPVPGTPGHEESLSIAKRLYGSLGCPIHVVAGNHDVGDKPPRMDARTEDERRVPRRLPRRVGRALGGLFLEGLPIPADRHAGARHAGPRKTSSGRGSSASSRRSTRRASDSSCSRTTRRSSTSPTSPGTTTISIPVRARGSSRCCGRSSPRPSSPGHVHHFFWNAIGPHGLLDPARRRRSCGPSTASSTRWRRSPRTVATTSTSSAS